MPPLYIFDLDGTLALTEHRQHYLEDEVKDWAAFYAACFEDTPNKSVIVTMDRLKKSGADIWIFTGRSDEVRAETIQWLYMHTCCFSSHAIDQMLTMRKEGDFTPDYVLKQRWLENMADADRKRLVAVFEDRGRVVDMWRANGVPCFQVAAGAF